MDWSPTMRIFALLEDSLRQERPGEDILVNGRYNSQSEAFRVTAGIIRLFRQSILENRSIPVFVLFPNRGDIIRFRRDQLKRYSTLIDFLEAESMPYIDLMDVFKGQSVKSLFHGHYTALANRLVAEGILSRLETLVPAPDTLGEPLGCSAHPDSRPGT